MFRKLSDLIRSEEGATAVEYGLIIAVVAVALIGILNSFGGELGQWFGSLADTVTGSGSGGTAPTGEI